MSTRAPEAAKPYTYFRRCDDFDATDVDELNKMVAAAKDSSYEAMQRHCAGLKRWALEQGYGLHDRRFTLKKDWHVSYHRSHIFGRPCYFLRWSSFEVIWIKGVARGEDPNPRPAEDADCRPKRVAQSRSLDTSSWRPR